MLHSFQATPPNGMVVICVDVGSVRSGLGWYTSTSETGSTLIGAVEFVSDSLQRGVPVALGFECPLFFPVPVVETDLGRAREFEGNRPWSAGAGSSVLATGMVQIPWTLREILVRMPVHSRPPAFLNWSAFTAAGAGLFLWEAFVTGKAKRKTHSEDAKAAVDAFLKPSSIVEPSSDGSVISVAGAALLQSGWSNDVNLLSCRCLVVRASQPEM